MHRFVERNLACAAELDVLLVVHRDPEGRWDAAVLSRQLRIDAAQAEQILKRLARNGLVRGDGTGYCYDPKTPTLAAAVKRLSELYPAFRVAIISLIFSRPAGPLRDFSDAFRIRSHPD